MKKWELGVTCGGEQGSAGAAPSRCLGSAEQTWKCETLCTHVSAPDERILSCSWSWSRTTEQRECQALLHSSLGEKLIMSLKYLAHFSLILISALHNSDSKLSRFFLRIAVVFWPQMTPRHWWVVHWGWESVCSATRVFLLTLSPVFWHQVSTVVLPLAYDMNSSWFCSWLIPSHWFKLTHCFYSTCPVVMYSKATGPLEYISATVKRHLYSGL